MKKKQPPPWHKHLTQEEREELDKADKAKAVWMELNRGRAAIVNRVINRMKYREGMR